MTTLSSRTVAIGVLLTLAYVLAANLGFSVALVAEQVTTVWAPTGLSQAALLLWGIRLWPAVWVGAFAVNAATGAPLWTALPIATGNTLEAVLAAWFLGRVIGFDPALQRTRDSLGFIVIAVVMAPIISATIGVSTLCIGGVQPWTQYFSLWFAWWLGDAIGAVIIGPLVLTVARASRGRSRQSWIETTAFVGGTVAVTEAGFGQQIVPMVGHHPLECIIFPFLMAAAVRQGQPATALVVFCAALIAIWNTIAGAGPFAVGDPHERLVLLQLFMGTAAGTGLLLAAAMAERDTSERRRAAAHAVSQVLAAGPSLPLAVNQILGAVCENLGWVHGAVWMVDESGAHLRCFTVWPASRPFSEATGAQTFARGAGLPGRVWASGEPAWIENIAAKRAGRECRDGSRRGVRRGSSTNAARVTTVSGSGLGPARRASRRPTRTSAAAGRTPPPAGTRARRDAASRRT